MDDLDRKNNIKEIIEWIICIAIAIILAILVRHYVGTPTVVKMQSMRTTLEPGDRLILNRLCITMKEEINRGDIITFEAPLDVTVADFDKDNPVATYREEPTNIIDKFTHYILEIGKESYIKRVIGVAGDHIVIEDRKSL